MSESQELSTYQLARNYFKAQCPYTDPRVYAKYIKRVQKRYDAMIADERERARECGKRAGRLEIKREIASILLISVLPREKILKVLDVSEKWLSNLKENLISNESSPPDEH